MTEILRLRPEGLIHSPAFSHVAVVPPGATTVYVGGQNAVDASGELIGGPDVAVQTQQALMNLRIALEAAGASVDDVISVTVLLVDGVDVNATYAPAASVFAGMAEPPLVTSAFVAGLGVPGALVEVAAVAAIAAR